MINNYQIYIALVIAVAAIPGPAVVMTIKNSLKYGYKVAASNIFGNFIAMVMLAMLSAMGLGAIILTSSTLFSAIRILGCIYLIYLGVKVWKTAHVEASSYQEQVKRNIKLSNALKEGFAVGLSNPKAIAFFTALFPQFIDPSRDFVTQFLALILTCEGISFLILMSYALLSTTIAKYLYNDNLMTIFNRLAALSFVGFGIAMIYED